MDKYQRIDRYAAISEWARKRYTINGVLVASLGTTPSRYTEIDNAAWRKYILAAK